MKETKITKKIADSKFAKKVVAGSSFLSAAAINAMTAYAGGSATANKMVHSAILTVGNIGRYIGLILLVWGIMQLVLAFKNEDADSKSRAIMITIVSIVLITLPNIISTIISTTDVSLSGGTAWI